MKFHELTIKEIKSYLASQDLNNFDMNIFDLLEKDERTGVHKLSRKYKSLLEKEEAKKENWKKMNSHIFDLEKEGFELIAGIDEAGRGPLAGPVVAASVILDSKKPIYGLDDSKKLSEKRREELYEIIKRDALYVGVGIIDNNIIDEVNILQATFKAMKKAIDDMNTIPDYILVDGNRKIPDLKIKQKAIIDGDCLINSIAAASIIAKVTRDRIIDDYDKEFPQYRFKSNKGYGTKEHIDALKKYGSTPIHRLSFSVVNKYHIKYFRESIKQTTNPIELKKLGERIAESSFFSKDNLRELRNLYQEKYRELNSAANF
ncbi:ribonuclease HII [Natronospora cellulosivora (SeqCode)]